MTWTAPISRLEPAIYFIGVPIGTARDITLRALDVLAVADVLAAEDTRSLRRLMEIHGVALGTRRIQSLHDHSSDAVQARLIDAVATGQSVAYASEAGMPLIADPGFELSRAAAEAGVKVTCVPGPSAVLTALALGGMPTDAFHFAGFPPSAKSARRKFLDGLAKIPATVVLFESPKRLAACLADAAHVMGSDRNAAICRELTKKFEEVRRGSLGALAEQISGTAVKGEIVLLIDRDAQTGREAISDDDINAQLAASLETLSVKDAAAQVAAQTGLKKRFLYQRALELTKSNKPEVNP